MSDAEKPDTLLAQLSWRFHPRMEELAVEALAYMLDRYPASSRGLADVVKRFVPDMRVSNQPFKTEIIAADGTRPDVLHRLDDSGIPYSDAGSRCVAIEGIAKHLFITDWTTLLDSIEEPLEDSAFGLAELRQLRGLVQFAKSGEGKSELGGKELVNRVTEIGKRSGWLHTKGLRATRRSYGYGRYVQLGRRHVLGVWLGVNADLFEDYGSTQLWVEGHSWSDDRRRWNELVRPALMERMNPNVHEKGEGLWVAVVPKGSTRANSYAAALERIAGIVDELAGQ